MGLSIMMTTASTLAAIVMTPLLTTWLAGTLVPVDPRALFASTMQVVWGWLRQARNRNPGLDACELGSFSMLFIFARQSVWVSRL